jgi:acyl-CoA reductase-like NAD-dependent aldehyde dehydrogenase
VRRRDFISLSAVLWCVAARRARAAWALRVCATTRHTHLGRKVKALELGDPLDEASDIGTIINEKQFNKVRGYVEEGLSS